MFKLSLSIALYCKSVTPHTSESWSEIRTLGELTTENEGLYSSKWVFVSLGFFPPSYSNLLLQILGY